MSLNFRPAKKKDLSDLIHLENEAFNSDRLSRYSFLHFIQSDKSDFIIAIEKNKIMGYYLLLYRQGTGLARLYSIAITHKKRGKGLGTQLLKHALDRCSFKAKSSMRLEVRPDNKVAIELYQSMGFKKLKIKPAFYEDLSDALVFEKRLVPSRLGMSIKVPYFAQNTEFTCGPSALMMAMSALNNRFKATLSEELKIWRESTTIFMTSGHGGCGPVGLGLAALERGFKAEVWLSEKNASFIEGVRTEAKKKILEMVQMDFLEKAKREKLPIKIERLKLGQLEKVTQKGGIPIILMSSYKITRSKAPHWVVLAGFDKEHYFVHDSDFHVVKPKDFTEASLSVPDMAYIPVLKKDFLKMAQYGKRRLQMVVVVFKKNKS